LGRGADSEFSQSEGGITINHNRVPCPAACYVTVEDQSHRAIPQTPCLVGWKTPSDTRGERSADVTKSIRREAREVVDGSAVLGEKTLSEIRNQKSGRYIISYSSEEGAKACSNRHVLYSA
jgi:hypothetical protein